MKIRLILGAVLGVFGLIGRTARAFIQPIEDEEHVNERRAAVRLEPLEKYAERFDLHWSPPVKQERVLLLGPVPH